MSLSVEQLVGRWRKKEASSGASRYPDEVEFFRDGTYRAASEGKRSDWDEAAFDVVGPEHLRVHTAWDRKVRYRASLDGDLLTIDDGRERVVYARVR
jgi:hypothetical protein